MDALLDKKILLGGHLCTLLVCKYILASCNNYIIYYNITYNNNIMLFLILFRFGHLDVVKYLVEVQGCAAGSVDGVGYTPLHFACV